MNFKWIFVFYGFFFFAVNTRLGEAKQFVLNEQIATDEDICTTFFQTEKYRKNPI